MMVREKVCTLPHQSAKMPKMYPPRTVPISVYVAIMPPSPSVRPNSLTMAAIAKERIRTSSPSMA